jgi:hypothetical protein
MRGADNLSNKLVKRGEACRREIFVRANVLEPQDYKKDFLRLHLDYGPTIRRR